MSEHAIKKTSIGGQALIEGILMRGPSKLAVAVRKPDGEIVTRIQKLDLPSMRHKVLRMPFIRGAVALFEAMYIGTEALMYSSSFMIDEEELEMNKKSFIDKVFKENADKVRNVLTIFTSVILAILFFMAIPSAIAGFMGKYVKSHFALNLIDGLVRMVFFLAYVYWISKLKDVKRIFEYHGAEHKTIHCYENGLPLTVENVKKFPIEHPRCGTSFLFMVMAVSILLLALFGWPDKYMRILIRVLMLPVIAGMTYEINKLIGKSEISLCKVLSKPGLLIQRYATVREPDDSMIEVAIRALEPVIPENGENDSW